MRAFSHAILLGSVLLLSLHGWGAVTKGDTRVRPSGRASEGFWVPPYLQRAPQTTPHSPLSNLRGWETVVKGDAGIPPLPATAAALKSYPPLAASGAASHPPASYIYDLNESAVEMPEEMAWIVAQVWLGCEVRAYALTPYADLSAVVGRAGERGQAQIHPVHFPAMQRAGLDPGRERDRIVYAIRLWERQRWEPWRGCDLPKGVSSHERHFRD